MLVMKTDSRQKNSTFTDHRFSSFPAKLIQISFLLSHNLHVRKAASILVCIVIDNPLLISKGNLLGTFACSRTTLDEILDGGVRETKEVCS